VSESPEKLIEALEQIAAINAYIHEHRHSMNNVQQTLEFLAGNWERKLDSLESRLTQRLDTMTTGFEVRMTALELRVNSLEAEKLRREGRDGAFALLLKSPVIGWLVAVGALIAGYFKIWNQPHG